MTERRITTALAALVPLLVLVLLGMFVTVPYVAVGAGDTADTLTTYAERDADGKVTDRKVITIDGLPVHQPAGQLPYQRRLRQLHVSLPPQHPLRPYLTLLEKQRGLKQQWFEGELVAVGVG